MLDIYRNYLLNIRNSLIQCGVNIPVESVDEYFDICKLQQELDDILYYYNILANSNSTDKLENFFIKFSVPLRKRIGDESYKEFLEFWEDYKKISSSYAVYQSLCAKLQELDKELASGGGYNVDSSVTTEDKQEKDSKENIKVEVDRQREDMFKRYYEPRVPEKEVKKKEEIKKNRVSLFEDLFEDSSSSNESTKETSTDGNSNTNEDSSTEEVSSGVNLDEEDTEEVSSGIDLDEEDTFNDSSDDLSDEDAESIFSGILQGSKSSEGDSKDVELVSHGNYLEDMLEEESEESEEDEDDGVTYEDEDESGNWMSDEDEEDSGNWISDDESEEDEDNGITYEDEDKSGNWMSDEDEEYDEEEYDENDNVSYVDEDDASWGISGDDEDEDNGITYEDEEESGNWLSDDEDDEDDGVTYEDEDSSSWNMSDEDDYEEDAELPNLSEGNDEEVQSQSVNEILNTGESKKEPEKDILDTLQTETSKFVNRGYRTIKNLEKRLKGV